MQWKLVLQNRQKRDFLTTFGHIGSENMASGAHDLHTTETTSALHVNQVY